MNECTNSILESLEKVSEEGVLLYRKEKLVTPQEIAAGSKVCEDMFYELEFVVVDENGNLKEMWFGDDKKSHKVW